MKQQRWLSFWSILLIAALLAACAGAAPAQPAAQPAQEQAAPAAASETGAAADKVFRLGHDIDLSTWDAHQEQQNVAMVFYSLVYEGLVGEDSQGNIVPGLATEWKQSDKTLEFTLREGVTFHDGTPFDAEVVKANVEKVKNGPFPPTANFLRPIESVEVIDPTHVRFNLTGPAPALLKNLQRFAGLMISPKVFDQLDKGPVGTGPWQYNAAESVAQSKYVFDVNPNYWDKSVQNVSRIEIWYLPDYQAAYNAVQSGEVDAATILENMVAQAESSGFTVLKPESFHLALHIFDRAGTKVKELGDPRVRQAMSLAIDRATYFNTLMSGIGIPSTQRWLKGQLGYCDEITNLDNDLEKAKALMKEAGVESFEFSVPAFGPFNLWNEGIAGFLKEIGITMKVEAIPPGPIIATATNGEWVAGLIPENERHPSDHFRNRLAAEGPMNPFQVKDDEIEAWGTEALALSDEEAAPLWSKISCRSAEQGDIIHLDGFVTPIMVNNNTVEHVDPMYMMPGVVYFRGVTMK